MWPSLAAAPCTPHAIAPVEAPAKAPTTAAPPALGPPEHPRTPCKKTTPRQSWQVQAPGHAYSPTATPSNFSAHPSASPASSRASTTTQLLHAFDGLDRISLQQSPRAQRHIHGVLALALSQCADGSPMAEAFLFNLGHGQPNHHLDAAGATTNKRTCASAEDLQERLRRAFEARLTPTRAEHVSEAFELPASTALTLHLPPAEYDALQAVLGGAPSSAVEGAVLARVVVASDALLGQPQDDPVVQRAVAKHLVGAIGAVDGSVWAVREMSRAAQGWTFTYHCRDSLQAWLRLNAENPARGVIGEYSQKLGDEVNSSREHVHQRATHRHG